MFLKLRASGQLVEILTLNDLFNAKHSEVVGRRHCATAVDELEKLKKRDLVFVSGESLPRCWTDPSFRAPEPPRPALDEAP